MFWEPRPRPKRCATPQNMPNICKHVLDVCNMYKHDLFIHVNECDVAHSWFPTLFSVHLLQAWSANAAGGCANSSRRCHGKDQGRRFFWWIHLDFYVLWCGICAFFPTMPAIFWDILARGITLKPNFVWTILLSRWFREVSCRARLLTDQSWPHWAAQGGRRQRLKAWCFLCFLCLWHRHHPSIIFPSSSTIQSFTIQPFTNHCINDPLLIIYCMIPALAISFHSVVTSASSWQWLRRCFFFFGPLLERVNQVLEHWMKAFEMAPRWNRVQEQRQWHFWHLLFVGPFGLWVGSTWRKHSGKTICHNACRCKLDRPDFEKLNAIGGQKSLSVSIRVMVSDGFSWMMGIFCLTSSTKRFPQWCRHCKCHMSTYLWLPVFV